MPTSNSVKKDQDALLAQVAAAPGWTVEKTSKHIIIKNPQGISVLTSTTPGQQQVIGILERQLKNELGWDPQALHERRLEDREKAMILDREKNEKRVIEAARAADAKFEAEMERLRGAVPPGTKLPNGEYVGFQRVIKVVTPFDAQVVLKQQETAVCAKRKVKRGNETDLRDAMNNGHFEFTPENPIFDEHGCLVQGHHRYRTIAGLDPDVLQKQYGHPGILLEIVINAPAKLNSVYDTGVSRSPADVLTLSGVPKYEFAVMAAVRLLMCYDDPTIDWRSYSKVKFSRDAMMTAFATKYSGIVDKPLQDGLVLKNKPIYMTHSIAMAVSFIVHRDLGVVDVPYKHPEGFTTTKWAQFRAGLLTGYDLGTGDPRKPFRDYLMSADRSHVINSRHIQFFYALKTVDAWTSGRELLFLKIAKNEAIPRFNK